MNLLVIVRQITLEVHVSVSFTKLFSPLLVRNVCVVEDDNMKPKFFLQCEGLCCKHNAIDGPLPFNFCSFHSNNEIIVMLCLFPIGQVLVAEVIIALGKLQGIALQHLWGLKSPSQQLFINEIFLCHKFKFRKTQKFTCNKIK